MRSCVRAVEEAIAGGDAAAADHLRRKWRAAGDRIETADQFVEHLGTRSSMTGKAYEVRTKDGATHEAAVWMREQLAR